MSVLIERVLLRNYKSIASCDVELKPLTVVVGRNGSGKSNFVDSLHFLADSLLSSLEYAIRKRGGIKAVTHRRANGHLWIEVIFRTHLDHTGTFALVLERGMVARETLTLRSADGSTIASYERRGTALRASVSEGALRPLPKVLHDRLALVSLSGLEPFREPFDALTAMRFYRLNPSAMREVQEADEGKVLSEDGSNIASVWGQMQKSKPAVLRRLTTYLSAIVPGVVKIHRRQLSHGETLHFHQAVDGERELQFNAASMSDGTLRALGALVATRQNNGAHEPVVVAIEEPETALHPAAVVALMDALHEASSRNQIVVTSHSADILDQIDFDRDSLLVTEYRDGSTVIGQADAASREAIRRHLYTPGELLRMDQLQPQSPVVE